MMMMIVTETLNYFCRFKTFTLRTKQDNFDFKKHVDLDGLCFTITTCCDTSTSHLPFYLLLSICVLYGHQVDQCCLSIFVIYQLYLDSSYRYRAR